MAMLEEKKLSLDEWQKAVVPLIEKGTYKNRLDKVKKEFMMLNQIIKCVIEDDKGNLFLCVGWADYGHIKGYVDITKFKEGVW